MGDFFMVVSAVGAVILVIAYINYRRVKARVDEAPAVQKDNDWLYFGIAMLVLIFVAFGWLFSLAHTQEKESQRPIEEKLHIEEFSYKGHQYIKFETNRTFDDISVVHDPNCECQLKKDSTNI